MYNEKQMLYTYKQRILLDNKQILYDSDLYFGRKRLIGIGSLRSLLSASKDPCKRFFYKLTIWGSITEERWCTLHVHHVGLPETTA